MGSSFFKGKAPDRSTLQCMTPYHEYVGHHNWTLWVKKKRRHESWEQEEEREFAEGNREERVDLFRGTGTREDLIWGQEERGSVLEGIEEGKNWG